MYQKSRVRMTVSIHGGKKPISLVDARGDIMSNGSKKQMTKTETLNSMADRTGLSRKQVADFFDELGKLIGDQLNDSGPGVLNIPGLMRIKVVRCRVGLI